ncbi:hypothetical protein L6654_27145 [Bradyrhizobium sp. WYCCWR 13023]|uniref:Uncharacterized protein n=1 Tax=Bradyrhizobium zhengyangense TaxID=2911009 RepID=A0A9X1REY5_9BRAD|nr:MULTISPECIES: hypothetical protein [Bradyrhizobium]MCG2630312.1 hypothetical protein [Bradyrhizobium zhengyangense]MCG2637840.1 hypothetical protein [Bradyrhizobium zhengyangense]MCG2666238.1 hypothetical protein [Bradyrhizobium zhengyangense]
MTPGKWYDPISERWIAPREFHVVAPSPHASENHVLEMQRSIEIQRIWRLLVDCCASK